jgi:hypothetical protein
MIRVLAPPEPTAVRGVADAVDTPVFARRHPSPEATAAGTPGGLSLLEPHPHWFEFHGQISIVRRTVADIVAAGVALNPKLSDQGVRWVEHVLRMVSINVVYCGQPVSRGICNPATGRSRVEQESLVESSTGPIGLGFELVHIQMDIQARTGVYLEGRIGDD